MTHDEKVKKLVGEFSSISGPVSLDKKTSNLFRRGDNAKNRLDVSLFNKVLSIENGLACVEGMITMEELATATLEKGLIPEVLVDLKTITAGGAVSGIAIESSSFKYGLFHETVEEMEVLTPKGEVVICSKKENSDLFYTLPNSYGTLGYILSLKIRLKKAKKYVKVTHLKYSDFKKCFEDLEMFFRNGEQDFLDGVVFGRDSQVITLGEFVDEAPNVSNYTYMNIYYKSLLKKDGDHLKTFDYLFRWDTDWWWGSQITPIKYTLLRFIFGKWALNSKTYSKLMRLGHKYPLISKLLVKDAEKEPVIQDIGIPRNNWEAFLDFLLTEIKILPIWLCPFKGNSDYPLFALEDRIYLDFGFWGFAQTKSVNMKWNRLVEAKTKDMKGIKSLYSEVTYSEDEFWETIDRDKYEIVKQKYDPEGRLKNLYEKLTNK